MHAGKYTNPTLFSADIGLTTFPAFPHIYLKIRFDNTSYFFDFSASGLDNSFTNYASIGKVAFLGSVADECGLMLDPLNASAIDMSIDIFDYTQG